MIFFVIVSNFFGGRVIFCSVRLHDFLTGEVV